MNDVFGTAPAGGSRAVIAALLPASIAAAELHGHPQLPALHQAEREALGRAGLQRLRDFTRGRACARRALLDFGVEAAPVLIGGDGAPLWPAGFVGSISHCPDYCAAAVGREAEFFAIGIDAEPHLALPPGVLDVIATRSEHHWLRAMAGASPCWDRILFSAKESAFKAGVRSWGARVPFDQLEISFDPKAGAFEAASPVNGAPKLPGRFRVASGLIVTSVVVAA